MARGKRSREGSARAQILSRRCGGALNRERYWVYYHVMGEVQVYREGPFTTLSEARRAAEEVDRDLVPVELWVQRKSESIWRQSRQATARVH